VQWGGKGSAGKSIRHFLKSQIIFAGCGLNPVEVYRRVETVDIARTLSAWMGTKPPSGCVGKVLVEVF